MKRILVSLCGVFLLSVPGAWSQNERLPQKGVVLVVGDGVSLELLTTARVYGKGAEGKLEMQKLPHTAFLSVWSRNSMVTDSSAGATALMRGFKCVNGRVGIRDAEGDTGPSLADVAKEHGWVVGVVSDDSVTGATPASLIVEHKHRGDVPAIARKILDALGPRADLVLGGGRAWFYVEENVKYPDGWKDVVEKTEAHAATLDVEIYRDWENFSNKAGEIDIAKHPVLGVFAKDALPFVADGKKRPQLAELTGAALDILGRTGKPFFLMVESGLADKAAHQNQGKRALEEVLELDATVALLDSRLSEDSTILVTTDHGTGGAALNGYLPLKSSPDSILKINPASKLPILSWATGPGGPKPDADPTAELPDPASPNGRQPAVAYAGAAMHTGGDVWAVGRGPGAKELHGFLDNTDVFRILKAAIEAAE
jgi:alkaline phosphatase